MGSTKITAGNRHRHYDMIVAKAANMDLVVFSYCNLDQLWSMDTPSQSGVYFIDSSNTDYFLCLPQHKEECLHWLNGGDVQNNISYPLMQDAWVPFCSFENESCEPWSVVCNFMRKESNFRISPKKEKRWIAFNKVSGSVHGPFLSAKSCKKYWPNLQTLEIEVEV